MYMVALLALRILYVVALVYFVLFLGFSPPAFSGTHGDRGIFIFSVQLTTIRIGNLTRLIHTLLYVMTIHTYSIIDPPSGGSMRVA